MEVLGLEHVELSVGDAGRSAAFYGIVLEAMGFRRLPHPRGLACWSNGKMAVLLRPAAPEHAGVAFDRYRVGLHHLAFKAAGRADVDELHRVLVREGLPVLDPPAEYPQYGQHYYAVFFADPDGMKLELVHFPWGFWKQLQREGRDPRPRGGPGPGADQ